MHTVNSAMLEKEKHEAILQRGDCQPIPGTRTLIEVDDMSMSPHEENKGDIILIPTPSSDPDDPLNWSRRRKFLATLCWTIYVFFLGFANSNTYSILVPFSEASNLPISTLNAGVGYLFLLAGYGLFWWQPFALQYGKRITYLISIAMQIPLSIWAVHISRSGEWYTKCILSGFFAAPSEALPELTVTDLYFQHERGRYMALYALVLIGSNFFAPIICGFINSGQGWQWVFYYAAIFCAAAFVFIFVCMEETNYTRCTHSGEDLSSSRSPTTELMPGVVTVRNHRRGLSESRRTFFQKMSLRDEPRPFMMLTCFRVQARFLSNPIVLYAGFAYGSTLIWFNVLNATSSYVLASSPYNFSTNIVGLAYLAPLVGTIVGYAATGRFSDWLVLRLARRNRGIVEPEFRLWLFAVSSILIPAALILWGVGASHEIHWFGLLVAMAMLAYANTCGASLSVNYLVDCYKEMSGNALTGLIVVRNTMSFAIGYGITPWVQAMGTQNAFILAAFIGLVCSLAFVIMMKWGKYFRRRSSQRYWEQVSEANVKGMVQ